MCKPGHSPASAADSQGSQSDPDLPVPSRMHGHLVVDIVTLCFIVVVALLYLVFRFWQKRKAAAAAREARRARPNPRKLVFLDHGNAVVTFLDFELVIRGSLARDHEHVAQRMAQREAGGPPSLTEMYSQDELDKANEATKLCYAQTAQSSGNTLNNVIDPQYPVGHAANITWPS